MSRDIRCTVEILTDGGFNVLGTKGQKLEIIKPEELNALIKGKTIKFAEVTPVSTYLELESGVLFINGVWVRIP